MKNILYQFLLLFALMAGCSVKDHQLDEAKAIYTESMKIHDEIMPLMDQMYTLRQSLGKQIDSLRKDSLHSSDQIQKTTLAVQNLNEADQSMMDWMHSSEVVPGSDDDVSPHHDQHSEQMSVASPEEITRIQKKQLADIKLILQHTEESIKKAREILM